MALVCLTIPSLPTKNTPFKSNDVNKTNINTSTLASAGAGKRYEKYASRRWFEPSRPQAAGLITNTGIGY